MRRQRCPWTIAPAANFANAPIATSVPAFSLAIAIGDTSVSALLGQGHPESRTHSLVWVSDLFAVGAVVGFDERGFATDKEARDKGARMRGACAIAQLVTIAIGIGCAKPEQMRRLPNGERWRLFGAESLRRSHDATAAREFSDDVLGATRLRDGAVMVAYADSAVIEVTDLTGGILRRLHLAPDSVGRESRIAAFGRCPSSGLAFAVNLSTRQLLIFNDTLRLIRTIPLNRRLLFLNIVDCDRESATGAEKRALFTINTGEVTPVAHLIRIGMKAGRLSVDTLHRLSETEFYFSKELRGFVEQPLGREAMVVRGRAGFYLGSTDDRRIELVDERGNSRGSSRIDLHDSQATVGDLLQWIHLRLLRERSAENQDFLRELIALAPVRSLRPMYTRLLRDSEDRLWLQTLELGAADSVRWYVTNARTGDTMAWIDLPSSFVPIEIGSRYMLGIEHSAGNHTRLLLRGYGRDNLVP